jgi:DNA-binding PadR family transcriptional regulator
MTPKAALTTPDLVVLSLLSESAMHGYQIATELEQREVRDWASVSRPQVYYSLRKLARLGLVEEAPDPEAPQGPERQRWRPTPTGAAALADALEAPAWATGRPPPPFLTWLALSHLSGPGVVATQFSRRCLFLRQELERERATLSELCAVSGPMAEAARWMVDITIRHLEVELAWLGEMSSALSGCR